MASGNTTLSNKISKKTFPFFHSKSVLKKGINNKNYSLNKY